MCASLNSRLQFSGIRFCSQPTKGLYDKQGIHFSLIKLHTCYCPNQVPVVLNGLLVSQRLPTIDMKNPVDSITKVHACST